jgi:hypothetical protein
VATPPTFVAAYGGASIYNAGTQTMSVTVAAGDLVLVKAGTQDSNVTVATPSGGGLTYTLQQAVQSVPQQSNAYLWTATAPGAQTFTLSLTGAGGQWSASVEVWRNHNGVGAAATKYATATTSLTLTTQAANSALSVLNVDWQGANGTTRTWLTSVGAFTEKVYQRSNAIITFYSGYHADAGTVGAKTVGMSAPTGQQPSLLAIEILAIPPAATGSLSITATALPNNIPPAVRINVNDTRSPGQALQLTIMRTNPDGTRVPVRTSDGNPLQLSGGVGLVFDNEPVLGGAVSYTSLEVPGISSPQVTVTASQAWLVHPGTPSKSIPIRFGLHPARHRTRPVVRGVFNVLGRANPVVVTDGTRHGRMLSLALLLQDQAALDAFEALTADAATLLLSVPASLGYNIPTAYIAIGDIDALPVVDRVSEHLFIASMAYYEVDRPSGGSRAAWTLADVQARYGTLTAVQTAYRTLADVQAGPA